METTLCDPINLTTTTATTTATTTTTTTTSTIQDANLKIRRCKHGRIIVKDSSKKKPVQRDRYRSRSRSRNRSPKYRGSSPKYRGSSPKYRGGSPKYRGSSPKYRGGSPKYRGGSPKYRGGSPKYRGSSPRGTSPKRSQARSPLSKDRESSSSSMSLSTDDSPSSDIYDPEGPVLPISPGDSPPLSPLNKATNNKITYEMGMEKDDDGLPSSAVQLNHQEKYLQKLNRQERVVEEVKLALKPHYQRRAIDKEQYKDVLRRAVPKICHSKNGEINPVKIRLLVDAYVKKMKRHK